MAGRREAERELAESERELADFFENATVGLHWVGPDGTILRANRAELDLLGYDREEYVGRHIAEFHADEDVIGDILRRLQAGEKLHDYPARLRCKDGSVKDVLIDSSVLWEGGEFVHTRCFTRDVTERKRAEAALRDSEGRFRTMAESIPQLAWMARPDGAHLLVQPAVARRTPARPPSEMEGWGWQSRSTTPSPALGAGAVEASIARGEPFDMVVPAAGGRTGTFRPFLTRVAPVRGDGRAGRPLVRHRTPTSPTAWRSSSELRAAKEEAEAANRAKDQFLAVLEPRAADAAEPDPAGGLVDAGPARPTPEEVRPTLEMIRQNVDLQARLIDDLLDVMRIVRGKMPLHWEVADCHRLIEQAVQICRSEVFGKRAAAGRWTWPPTDHHVNADPARLQQVFWNLIKNAVKFTPEGGTIADPHPQRGRPGVETARRRGVRHRHRHRAGGPAHDLRPVPAGGDDDHPQVRRAGAGAGDLQGASSRPTAGRSPPRAAGKGRGRRSGSVLKALPEPGRSRATASRPAASAEAATAPPSPLRILVVEDEPATLRLMARLLRGLGPRRHDGGHDRRGAWRRPRRASST